MCVCVQPSHTNTSVEWHVSIQRLKNVGVIERGEERLDRKAKDFPKSLFHSESLSPHSRRGLTDPLVWEAFRYLWKLRVKELNTGECGDAFLRRSPSPPCSSCRGLARARLAAAALRGRCRLDASRKLVYAAANAPLKAVMQIRLVWLMHAGWPPLPGTWCRDRSEQLPCLITSIECDRHKEGFQSEGTATQTRYQNAKAAVVFKDRSHGLLMNICFTKVTTKNTLAIS